MSKLSILKDIAKIGAAALGPAGAIVGLFNPLAGGILTAVAKTAANVQSTIPDAPPAEKKEVFAQSIAPEIKNTTGQQPTAEQVAAAMAVLEHLIPMANALAAATKAPTQGIVVPGIDPTSAVGKVGG